MKFYINEVKLDKYKRDYNKRVIGLFDNCECHGEGNFCGWYGSEYYDKVTLIAYYVQGVPGNVCIDFKRPYSEFQVINKHFDKIEIGSRYWTKQFDCGSVGEAIEIFKEQAWNTDE